ncbi:MAG: Gfo/Idh/MocA family oxidoreductase [Tannerella sp.]|jgi:virulence factor|nr:Gfo/Idh/MocA family oxidoreductase [Tannerella sp.]
MKRIIEKYKKQRKYRHLSRQYLHKYAFVGVGNHSLNNLYPVLDFMRVPLKYVLTAGEKTAEILNKSSAKEYTAVCDPDVVLRDEAVKGVFISASPESHYALAKRMLQGGKSVFVEKPPCRNMAELDRLIRLEEETGRFVVAGMQKRYAPACSVLRKRLKRPEHYTYKFCTGAYPEGEDVLTELFIHPVDLAVFLFGQAVLVSMLQNGKTFLLQLMHENGVIGSLELSTSYSWQTAEERLVIVEKNGVYELNNMSEVLYKKKPPVIGNIPVEKVMKCNPVTEILFNQNMFQPVMQHNNIYVNGFYSELETFVSMCESSKPTQNLSAPALLKPTYRLLDEIREKSRKV